jgi:predicted GNAT family N-acyltransferase
MDILDTKSAVPARGSAQEWETFHAVKEGLRVGRLPAHWMGDVLSLTHARMTRDAASVETMLRVQRINSDSFWGIFERNESGLHRLAGYQAMLFLNREGVEALLDRSLDTREPESRFVAPSGERPAAIYNWGVVAEGLTRIVGPTIMQRMPRLYYGLMHYATPATEAGYKAGVKGGYKPVTPHDDRLGGLFRFDGFLSPAARETTLKIVVATGPVEFAQALAIRSAVFVAEQDCPYDEEFDGNDYCATHLVGYVDGEPAATMRMRYFADWVKVERMAVLSRFRRTNIKYEIVRAAFELARRKGYRLVYGHAQRRLLKFWQQFGFEIYPRNSEIRFSDFDYVEIIKRLAPHADPLTMRSDPMVLIRPEGTWDDIGVLERSAHRPAAHRATDAA